MPRRRWAAAVAALFTTLAVGTVLPAIGRPSPPRAGTFAAAGIDGSVGGMQPVNLPARVSRFAWAPGGSEGWAIGHVIGYQPGWDSAAGDGQVVFLRHGKGGWSVDGPPVDAAGAVKNPTLSAIALAKDGEGWAVGPGGMAVHREPGGRWVVQSLCPAVTCEDLAAVSLSPSGDSGYAVGNASTILRLDDGRWAADEVTVATAEQRIGLVAVADAGDGDAWAVAGSSSRSLQLFRRSTGWGRVTTGKPLFDGPHPTSSNESGATNLAVVGTSTVRAADGSVWFGGGMFPVDPGKPLGDPATGDTQRPFTIRFDDGQFTSYCADQYSLATTRSQTTKLCDRPLPVSPYEITSLAAAPEGDVLAGGLGLFRFKDDGWYREPNAVGYISSLAFSAANEGWAATSGDTLGAGGTAHSSSITVGHYTARPDWPMTARWSQPSRQVLQAVATGAEGKALAVGTDGNTLVFTPGIGWDATLRRTDRALHAVAWDSPTTGWAVGERGIVLRYDGTRFEIDEAATAATAQSLFAVAFGAGGRGYAVGSTGALLVFEGGAWRRDPASGKAAKSTLYGITAVGNGFVAVGADATVLVNATGAPGDWKADASLANAVRRPRLALPALYSASSNGGRVLIAGEQSVLASGPAAGPFAPFSAPLEGTLLDAAGAPDGRIVAAVAPPGARKFLGDEVTASQSWVRVFDGGRWRDGELAHRITGPGQVETAAGRDPVLAVSLEPGRSSGWAVGGLRDNLPDGDGHLSVSSTSSVFRVDPDGDPAQPGARVKPLFAEAPGAFSLAFFSETSCDANLCSINTGAGGAPDTVAQAIQAEVNELSGVEGGPRFVLFGGNARTVGIPEELGAFRGYLADFTVPAFAAPGSRDVFSSLSSGAVAIPPGFGDNVYSPPSAARQVAPGNQFFLAEFADQAAPWGTDGHVEKGFEAVDVGEAARKGSARTHYAFDYKQDGEVKARFVMVDTSTGQIGRPKDGTQNPDEDQSAWLNSVLADARANGVPTVVAMNQPTVDPTAQVAAPVLADGAVFEGTATSLGVSAVLAGFVRANAVYHVPSQQAPVNVPFIISGSGGAALGGSRFPTDGHFHAWQLVTVDPTGISLTNPQATVRVRTIPVLESVALRAVDGLAADTGSTLRFDALGRGIDGGSPSNDPTQGRRQYLQFPLPNACPDAGPFFGGCQSQSALRPDYHFVSEDPSIAQFVARETDITPLVRDGHLIPDDQSGLLCAMRPGTVWVNIVSGVHRSRMPVTVRPGEGLCSKYPVLPAAAPAFEPAAAPPAPGPAPAPAASPAAKPFTPAPPIPDSVALVLPPAPAPIAAPSPPASAAGASKEEEEPETQTEGQEGDGAPGAEFRRLSHDRQPYDPGWWMVMAAAALGFVGAGSTALLRQRRPKPAVERRHG